MELNPIFNLTVKPTDVSSLVGDGDKKPKKPYDFGAELKGAFGNKLKYDNNLPIKDVVLSAAKIGGVDPSFLLSSGWIEGMNKAVLKPDDKSEAYGNAANGILEFQGVRPRTNQAKLDTKNFPVDGFYNYGLDTFGNRYDAIKKYLPAGFENRFQLYDAYNDAKVKDSKTGKMVDNPQKIKTAAFRTNQDALIAKSAMLRNEMDTVDAYAKKKGIVLDDKAKKYFTLASYNSGGGNAKIMMDEYSKAKDKNAFIDKGLTSRKGVHANVSPRMSTMQVANELLTAQ